ncbi:hypothetical protein CC78DRAFT_531043 [Lojkania enalia]|uniref:Rhodopsin domain-containing protein n=1 Tax=Lojkania enalia TaxID=147567 RepID=A0A9P4N6B6_9PLEO|nr:hypothetical protein CC78DRAFT_531043 [Didymosphaeria enalia]
MGLGGGMLFVCVGLLVARLWSRLRPYRRLHWDDWMVLAATILAVVNYILTALSVVNGLGRHVRFVSFSHRRESLRFIFINQVVWYWSITLVKLSVAYLLLRVKRESKRWRYFLISIMIFLVLVAGVSTIFQFTQCRPFQVFWDPGVFRQGPVKCFAQGVINGNIVGFSVVSVATDLIFSLIPITFIRKLNRPRRERIFMCILMGLGLFASAAAIMRTVQLQYFYTSPDLLRMSVTVVLWAQVEQQFAIIAATMPTLKAFLEKTLVKIGHFFYDQGTETQVMAKLVKFGLLDKEQTKVSKEEEQSEIKSPVRNRKKLRDEFGDTIPDARNDKEVEEILVKGGGLSA